MMVGRTEAEVLKTQFSEPLEQIHAALHRQGHWQGESIQLKRDGTRLAAASCWSLQRNAAGAPIRILSVDEDISVIATVPADSERPLSFASV